MRENMGTESQPLS